MDSLQYLGALDHVFKTRDGFKPCYKWIAFNTQQV